MAKSAKKQKSPNAAPTPVAPDFIDLSAWAQADQYLATALLEAHRLCSRIDKAERKIAKASRPIIKHFAEIEGDALLIRQSVIEAGRLRGLKLFGDPGEICAFDPLRHELTRAPEKNSKKTAAKVRIKTPGVFNTVNNDDRILIRARVTAVKTSEYKKAARR